MKIRAAMPTSTSTTVVSIPRFMALPHVGSGRSAKPGEPGGETFLADTGSAQVAKTFLAYQRLERTGL
jgi:hypothetical protein